MVISKPRITVIGSLNTDLITRTARLPVPGETVISQSFDTGCGGKGANQAVACARLSRSRLSPQHGSVDVGMDGAVGDDLFGKTLLEGLHDNYVDATDVETRENEKSGVATIIVEEQTGENRILMSPNANYSLKPERYTTLGKIHPDLIIMQLEIPLDATLGILKAAKEQKIEVLFNPAPAQKLPEEAYEAISHLIVNESEAAIITGNEGKDLDWSLSGPHMEHLFNLGVQHIVVTLGARGVLYHDTIEAYTKTFKAEKVEVKDTTAAGDTFVGAYAVAILGNGKDRSPETMARAVAWANKAAAKTVEREGAQAAIPWLDDMPKISEIDSSRIKGD
ncbi:MAG: hypothetical protein Q9164_001453 [Protoblastenia rupestris]